MNKSLIVLMAAASPLLSAPASAQTSGPDITVLRTLGPRLGVRLMEVDQEAVTRLKLKEEKGALVTEVVDGSAAEKAGIKKDDVIVRYQGESILTAAQLGRLVRDTPAGRKVAIDLVRAGAPVQATATLERASVWNDGEGPQIIGKELNERLGKMGDLRFRLRGKGAEPRVFDFEMDKDVEKEMEKDGEKELNEEDRDHHVFRYRMNELGPQWFSGTTGRGRLGISYTEIDGQLAKYFHAPADTAIMVNSVVEGSAAEKAGIKAGDLVTAVGGEKVEDGSDLQKAVRRLEPGKSSPISVWRNGKGLDLSVTLGGDKSEKKTAPRSLKPLT